MHSRMKFIIPLFYLLAAFQGCYSDANHHIPAKKFNPSPSLVFPVTGNVHPIGYYHVTMNIGNPPKPYYLDIDTGSDVTWLQCDAPCLRCTPTPHPLYKPSNNLVGCMEPQCKAVHWPNQPPNCESPQDQCDYEVEYADSGSSLGVLVTDSVSLQFMNGTVVKPHLAFGCGYDQQFPPSTNTFIDGVLGLGPGKSTILHQLQELGVTRNVVGHCLSAQGDGYLFFGDEVVPSSGVTWVPATTKIQKHYSLGTVDLYFGGKPSGIKGLPLVLDSGSTYTYFAVEAYKALISMLLEDMKGKQLYNAVEDTILPTCWKGSKPFKSIQDVKNLFKPIVLSFPSTKIFHWFQKVQFQLDPEAYLIISEHGNVCLGILNSAESGLGSLNVIGDISFQDKIIIYDNEKQQIGWAPANCNKLPKS